MKQFALAIGALAMFSAELAYAGDIGYVEDFALAKERAEALKKLIPGTEDYYYYHVLHYLNTGELDKAAATFGPWYQRFNQTGRLTQMQTRHAILSYDKNPKATLAYLTQRLSLSFDHQKVSNNVVNNLPTTLDQNRISAREMGNVARQRWAQGTDVYEEQAIDIALASAPDGNLRRHMLQRLTRPDVDNLVKHISDDLSFEHSGGFGSLNIHNRLTQSQLEALLKIRPDLIDNGNLVNAWIVRLAPGNDEDWRRTPELTKAYLDRLVAFTRKLNPAFNSLKAHALYHRLLLDETLGVFNRDMFIEYLNLPRFQPYMSQVMLNRHDPRNPAADLNMNYQSFTRLQPIGSDEALVRNYLKNFLLNAETPKAFEPYINDTFLKHLFAEVKIENGLGEPETHAALLPPELFRQLKDRIDIDFAATNKTTFTADEAVSLELYTKNVPTLMVKIFEINTSNFYRGQRREIDTAVSLDGLVANAEKIYTYTETPFRRVPRKLEFPQISKPGVYVIDFIGAGKSSRALIRKGRLRAIEGMSTAGQKLTIIDESDKVVPGAAVWFGGQEYKANENGVAIVPFSTTPSRQPIVLSKGDFSSLDFLDHRAETYAMEAGIHVDRESLLPQRVSSLVVRPSLKLNGFPVSIKLLEEVRLVVTATDHDGINTATQVPSFKLFEDRESIYDFRVPTRLSRLTVSMHAKVKCLSTGQEIDLFSVASFEMNGIDKTDKLEDLHFAKFGDNYVIETLGRTGEARPDQTVAVVLKHRHYTEPYRTQLKCDANGRVHLGALADIDSVTANGSSGVVHNWKLPTTRHTYRQTMHAKLGDTITLPYVGSETKPNRSEFALFELRGEHLYSDRFDNITIKDGMIEIADLPAGDYQLLLKNSREAMRLRVVDGTVEAGYVLGKIRHLQLPALKPVQVTGLTSDEEFISIRLRDHSPFTRVHLFATRYLPEFDGFDNLGRVRDVPLRGQSPLMTESMYLAGRNIGDEYRYILDRRLQKKFPGNMLERPSFLLNPWIVRSTDAGEQQAMEGEEHRKMLKSQGGVAMQELLRSGGGNGWQAGSSQFANIDYLADASAILLNHIPDKDGIIKIKKGDLGPHSMIHVIAVDPLNTTARTLSLAEQKAGFVDLRLRNGLDPARHFTQQKQTSTLAAKQPFTIADAASSRFEMYDSLAKVYSLYNTLSHDPKLAEFAFILKWPTLKLEEKQALYSKYACHELNFFIAQKDPAFFVATVKPYLANKKDQTFMDHYLLGHDLQSYLQPFAHARLNSAERVLLARRIQGEQVKTARHLQDVLRLLPPQNDREKMLFETALRNGELGLDATLKNPVPTPVSLIPAAPPEPVVPNGDPKSGPADMAAGGAMPGMMGRSGKAKVQMMRERDGRSAGDAKDEAKKAMEQVDDLKEERAELHKLQDSVKDVELSFHDEDRKGKDAPARLYRKVDVTQELAENNYYKLPIQSQVAVLVPVSGFWHDYAKHEAGKPFLSSNLADASRNFAEMMLALAVIDLPFAAEQHLVKFDNGSMIFTPGNQVLAFHEEVKPVAAAGDKVQILVSQNFYRAGDRFTQVDGEQVDKFITNEFVIHTVYGCQVVITNPTSSRQRLSVLLQVPVGALPVSNGQLTKTVWIELEPYHTRTLDTMFYFPRAGQFAHFPVHVAKGETLAAAAKPFRFNVVNEPSSLDTESWDYISQNGTNARVAEFLNRENVAGLDLGKIAWRMRDKAFFEEAIALLKDRHAFHPVLWSYGLYHNALPQSREFLTTNEQLVGELGGPIEAPLLTVDLVERHRYEHLEYKPLINARAHSLGQNRQIVNNRVHEQYSRYLHMISFRGKLTDDDLLDAAHYLLLQDRVEEALDAFNRVNPANVTAKMQYDYCAAYMDLFSDDLKKVRSIIARYNNHPVERWRNAFAAIQNQLDEIDGKNGKLVDKDDQAQQQAKLAAQESTFEFGVAAKTINLTWKNVEKVRVNYYLMDVELLFSRAPFVAQGSGQFSLIRPNDTAEYKLPNFQNKLAIPMPENLADKNVLVEIVANGKTRAVPVLAGVMQVSVNENYGQLQVTDAQNGKMLAKVYVKAYVRLGDGTVKFRKDGYTDHRGKFDYASVSTPERSAIQRFSVLVLSDTQGAVIKEAAPPAQ